MASRKHFKKLCTNNRSELPVFASACLSRQSAVGGKVKRKHILLHAICSCRSMNITDTNEHENHKYNCSYNVLRAKVKYPGDA